MSRRVHRLRVRVRACFRRALAACDAVAIRSGSLRAARGRRRPCPRSRCAGLALCALAAALAGCSTSRYFETRPQASYPAAAALPSHPFPATGLPMFVGSDGRILTWTDLMAGVAWADVVILGEIHDDAVGHSVQLALLENIMSLDPETALSMEMLERDEQPIVDEYLAGTIDAATFTARTSSADWGGKGTWEEWYLPMIDVARRHGAPVVAANAPRRFVRMARLEGFDALKALPADERAFFTLPRRLPDDGYELRFRALMERMAEQAGNPPPSAEAMAATFRAQSVWDATMAASIAEQLRSPLAVFGDSRRSGRVVHLVGQFHSDFNGGLVQELRMRRPGARILVISLRPQRLLALAEEDVGRGDAVIYTGWTGRDDAAYAPGQRTPRWPAAQEE
ncbi:MAG TPA: ChaN family lipoprotein [Phycisphaerales bacterium]|nr:ChaN family lipoprotein [Phycisphaerales bacterium]HMP36833.1 ChaN family lipoprotein [Phycisphaerales bacterium]